MKVLFKALSALPLGLMHALGALVGWAAFLLSPVYRKRFLDNSKSAGFSFAQVKNAISSAGCMTTELPKLWMGDTPPYQWEGGHADGAAAQGDPVATQAYQSGRGVIFLTPHLGCFEIVAQALAARYAAAHGPLTVLFRPARKAYLADITATSRDRPGLQAVPAGLHGVRQMIKALRKGQAVGLLPDQVPPLGMGVWAPFFGKPAYTMTLAARLAQQTGAVVVLAWGQRLPWGRGYKLHFRSIAEPIAPDLDAAVLQINQAMERLIAECPGQYLWSYARYKAPRDESLGQETEKAA
jgi:Kdo2-lipid IVA lauroyltransferase/acyltransferase